LISEFLDFFSSSSFLFDLGFSLLILLSSFSFSFLFSSELFDIFKLLLFLLPLLLLSILLSLLFFSIAILLIWGFFWFPIYLFHFQYFSHLHLNYY
jgi:hypothetical protein